MLNSLISVASLMASTLLMMTGYGLMNYLVQIRALAEGWSTLSISIIATGYTCGFVVAGLVVPKLVQRVGHVRVFGAVITLLTVSCLSCSLVVNEFAWFAFRGLAGFAIAGAYMIIESWLNERVNNENRGSLFSFYMVTSLVGSIAGQYFVPLGDPLTTGLFITCGIIFSFALLPTTLSSAQSPMPISQGKFDLPKLFRRSPIAFIGSLLSGALWGTWGSLGGVFAQRIGFTTAEGATLLAACLAGGAIFQIPIGRLSDKFDRRLVMIGCGVIGGLACVVMGLVGASVITYFAAFMLGIGLFPIYALNAAHANDLADPQEYVTISSGIMILYGLGTVGGPLLSGVVMNATGPLGMIWLMMVLFVIYAAYAAWRRTRRADLEGVVDKTDFQAMAVPINATDPVNSPGSALSEEI
jgi:MFS family permease